MEQQTVPFLTEKVRTLQRLVDDQMESLIGKELLILKLKEEAARETQDAGTQTPNEPVVERIMREYNELKAEHAKLARELKTASAGAEDVRRRGEQRPGDRLNAERLKKENEALMEMVQRQSYQSQQRLSVCLSGGSCAVDRRAEHREAKAVD